MVSQAGASAAQRLVGSVGINNPGSPRPDAKNDRQTPDSTQVAGVYSHLRGRQDALNQAASVLREVGKGVEKAGKLLDKVESSLDQIVKMFPPYPVNSPIRVSLLNKVSGLHQQIDQLTFPSPDTVNVVNRLLNGKTDASANPIAGVQHQLWDLPTLDPQAASDQQVSQALDQVKALQADLKASQTGMWQDVVSFVRKAETPEARNQAAGVRAQLAEPSISGIGGSSSQLVQATESK
jgi:hypothetical protein